MSHTTPKWTMPYDSVTPHPLYQKSVIEKIIRCEPGTVVLVDQDIHVRYSLCWYVTDASNLKPLEFYPHIYCVDGVISAILSLLCPESGAKPIILTSRSWTTCNFDFPPIYSAFSGKCIMLDRGCDIKGCCELALACDVNQGGPHLCKKHAIELNKKRKKEGQSNSFWRLCNPRAVHMVQVATIYHNRKTCETNKNFSLIFEKVNPTQPMAPTKNIIGRFVCTLDGNLQHIDKLFENEESYDAEEEENSYEEEYEDEEGYEEEISTDNEEDVLPGLISAHYISHPYYESYGMGHDRGVFNKCKCVLNHLRNSIFSNLVTDSWTRLENLIYNRQTK